jgi:hypothetical protein
MRTTPAWRGALCAAIDSGVARFSARCDPLRRSAVLCAMRTPNVAVRLALRAAFASPGAIKLLEQLAP